MPTSLTNSKITFDTKSISETNGKLDILPVGFVYWQLPGKKAPGEMFAGTWTRISGTGKEFDGIFFRAEGINAASFGNSQSEGLPNITASSDQFDDTSGWTSTMSLQGAFYNIKRSGVTGRVTGDSGSGVQWYRFGFDASRSNSIYGSSQHVTPVNTSIRLWERTA